MSLPIKKLYIDTKYKNRESVSNSNFKIDLPQTLYFPDNSVFYIDDISIPHSWYTIEQNVNDKLYIEISHVDSNVGTTVDSYQIVTISPGIYNGVELALEIQTKIEASINNSIFPNLLIVTYDSKRNSINITTGYVDIRFKILILICCHYVTPNNCITPASMLPELNVNCTASIAAVTLQ